MVLTHTTDTGSPHTSNQGADSSPTCSIATCIHENSRKHFRSEPFINSAVSLVLCNTHEVCPHTYVERYLPVVQTDRGSVGHSHTLNTPGVECLVRHNHTALILHKGTHAFRSSSIAMYMRRGAFEVGSYWFDRKLSATIFSRVNYSTCSWALAGGCSAII